MELAGSPAEQRPRVPEEDDNDDDWRSRPRLPAEPGQYGFQAGPPFPDGTLRGRHGPVAGGSSGRGGRSGLTAVGSGGSPGAKQVEVPPQSIPPPPTPPHLK